MQHDVKHQPTSDTWYITPIANNVNLEFIITQTSKTTKQPSNHRTCATHEVCNIEQAMSFILNMTEENAWQKQ